MLTLGQVSQERGSAPGGVGAVSSAYSLFSEPSEQGYSSWGTNVFNPTKAEQKFNATQAAIDRSFSAFEAQKQRDYEERMSNTAYQRAVSDLRAAGLNPYLAATGNSASTPSGAVASSSGARASAHTGAFEHLVGSAIQLATAVISKSMPVRTSGVKHTYVHHYR